MHCKEDVECQYLGRPIGHVISGQVRELVEGSGLGCEVLHADQGMRIGERIAIVFCWVRCIGALTDGSFI